MKYSNTKEDRWKNIINDGLITKVLFLKTPPKMNVGNTLVTRRINKISPISEVALVEEIDISKSGITNQLKTLKKEGTQK